ncbi:MAG: DUF4382 domain-containing protein [Halorientalis sp.]
MRGSAAVLAVVLVALAGCSGDPVGSGTGTVAYHVSDHPDTLSDFAHLNVTVTRVGLHRAGTPADNASAWTTRDVNATLDLTRLAGANATLLTRLAVDSGRYDRAVIHVARAEGRLVTGRPATVRVPSERLTVATGFTVRADESVPFVFDLMVVRTGAGWGYLLRPVARESGAHRPLTPVDARVG